MTDAARARRIKLLWREKRTEAWVYLRRNSRFEAMSPPPAPPPMTFRSVHAPACMDATREVITFRLEFEDPPGRGWRVMAGDIPLEHGDRSHLR